MAVGAMSAKLSNVGLAVGVAGVLSFLFGNGRVRRRPADWLPGAAAVLVLTTVVMARSYVLSGYLLFPAAWSAFGLHPAHQVPAALAANVTRETRAWGWVEIPRATLAGIAKARLPVISAASDWLARSGTSRAFPVLPYLAAFPLLTFTSHVVPLVLLVAAAVAVWRGGRADRLPLFLALAPATGLLAWVVLAPEARFSSHHAWAVLALAAAAVCGGREGPGRRFWLWTPTATFLVLVVFGTGWSAVRKVVTDRPIDWVWIRSEIAGCRPLFVDPDPLIYTTESGLRLTVPPSHYAEWGPLLATPYPEPTLRLLDPNGRPAFATDPRRVRVPPVLMPPATSAPAASAAPMRN